MAYDSTDLRSQLTTAPSAVGSNVAPQCFEFTKQPPTESTEAGRLWWSRSQAIVANYVQLKAGEPLRRIGQPDEYVVLVHERAVSLTVSTSSEQVSVVGRSVVIVPPGDSALVAHQETELMRFFTSQSADLCSRCDNNEFYADRDPNVASWAPWPDPIDGFRIRVYPLDDVAPSADRFGRIFRCSTFMINYFDEAVGPRDPSKMSPHTHDDFEQLSVQFEGDYVHHIRTPWVPDMSRWRDDEHRHATSPSVTVIPPPSIHTSQAIGAGMHQLVDVFAPPRHDFSAKPGWVLNADEYPMPA